MFYMSILDAISVNDNQRLAANSNKKPTKLFPKSIGTCLVGLCVCDMALCHSRLRTSQFLNKCQRKA